MKPSKNTDITDEDARLFARKTYKEVTLWDWAARIFPLAALMIIAVLWFFKLDSMLDIVLDATIVVFFLICFIWWYWAIYKIAVTVKFMRRSQEKFAELQKEIKTFRKLLDNNENNRYH